MKRNLEDRSSKLSCAHRALPHLLATYSSWKLPCKDPAKEELLNWLYPVVPPRLGTRRGQRQHPSFAAFVPPVGRARE